MRMRTLGAALALAAATVFAPFSTAWATTIGVDITSGGTAMNNGDFTLGWGFDVTTPVTVSSLGFWDESGDGLVATHEVGLWQSNGTLLASTTVSNGSPIVIASGSGLGNWVFQPIAPVTLAAGSYQVGGVSNGRELYQTIVGAIALDPQLSSFDSNLFEFGSTLQFMSQQEGSSVWSGLFGANLQVAPVPEPATLLLLGTGLGAVAARRRLKRRA